MHYYISTDGNTIQYLGKANSVPKTCVEITKEMYFRYKSILNNVVDLDGYRTVVTLYIDGTCETKYIVEESEITE